MTLKNATQFEEKLTCGLENDMRNLANFQQSPWECQNWDFDEILLSKVENALAKNWQRIYVYWHWRNFKNLKRNWLLVSKLTRGIWQYLTWALESLKNLRFNGLLLTDAFNVWAKNVQRSYLAWHFSDGKFQRKMTCASKNKKRNLENFHQGTRKSQNWDFDGILLSKVQNV